MTRKRNGDYRVKDDPAFVILVNGEDDLAYLHSFNQHGPIIRSTSKLFTKRGADNLLAKMRNAGWLVGDFEVFRF